MVPVKVVLLGEATREEAEVVPLIFNLRESLAAANQIAGSRGLLFEAAGLGRWSPVSSTAFLPFKTWPGHAGRHQHGIRFE